MMTLTTSRRRRPRLSHDHDHDDRYMTKNTPSVSSHVQPSHAMPTHVSFCIVAYPVGKHMDNAVIFEPEKGDGDDDDLDGQCLIEKLL